MSALTTKGIKNESTISKTFGPGPIDAKINNITIETPGYKDGADQRIIMLHLEGPALGDFEGFLVDKNNQNGPRYAGQIGRVKLTYWAFKDGQNPKTGVKYDRNDSILKALDSLAKVLGKKDKLDLISASTIEEYVELAGKVLSGPTVLSFCVGGKEYLNKDGYSTYELFLVKGDRNRYSYEIAGTKPSKLVTFNANDENHIKPLTAGDAPANARSAADDDTNMNSVPAGAPVEEDDFKF